METQQYTHPRVFNLSACLSTYRTELYLPLDTVHITHQVSYHYTTSTPLLHTNPIQTVIYLALYRFWTSQHPIFTLPSKPHSIHGDIPAYKQLHPYQSCVTIWIFLTKNFNVHLGTDESYKAVPWICVEVHLYVLYVISHIKSHHWNSIMVIYRRQYFRCDGSQILA